MGRSTGNLPRQLHRSSPDTQEVLLVAKVRAYYFETAIQETHRFPPLGFLARNGPNDDLQISQYVAS